MSMDLVRFGCILLLMTPSAVELSVWTGIIECLCPISFSIILMYTAYRAMMYRAPILASAADAITFFMICAMARIAPLLAGCSTFSERKKWPPARLLELVFLRYPASLCAARSMSGSRVKGQGSRVKGQGSRVKGQGSRVKGQGSLPANMKIGRASC